MELDLSIVAWVSSASSAVDDDDEFFFARRHAIARLCYALYQTSLSVSLSVTNLSSAETAECRPRITQTKSHDDLGTLVF